jgi:hypothetical protein
MLIWIKFVPYNKKSVVSGNAGASSGICQIAAQNGSNCSRGKKEKTGEGGPSSFISHRDLSAAAACAASTDCPKLHQDTFSLSRRLSV